MQVTRIDIANCQEIVTALKVEGNKYHTDIANWQEIVTALKAESNENQYSKVVGNIDGLSRLKLTRIDIEKWREILTAL